MINIEMMISFLNKIEKLKCITRHSWTSEGRKESVAEHSWRLAIMIYLLRDESFPAHSCIPSSLIFLERFG